VKAINERFHLHRFGEGLSVEKSNGVALAVYSKEIGYGSIRVIRSRKEAGVSVKVNGRHSSVLTFAALIYVAEAEP
jgi:hypothetical protein